ncbi:MAG: PEP-CTERM sorting domain-containing protein [Planctomycetota bacterium]
MTMRDRVWRSVVCGLAGTVVIATMVHQASAGVVVNWGGNYVASSQTFANSRSDNLGPSDVYGDPVLPLTYTDSLGFSGTITGRLQSGTSDYTTYNDLYNPTIGANYSGQSDRFYGGHAVVFSAPPNYGLSNLIVENQGGDDKIHVEVKPDADLQRFAMLTYWDKTDFLGGGSQFLVNGTSTFSLTSTQDSQAKDAVGHSLRWVIRNGSQFYLSTVLSFANSSTYTSSILSLTNWTEYNPFAPGPPDIRNLLLSNSAGTTFAGGSLFNNVTAVGFYVEYQRPSDRQGAGDIDYKIGSFNAVLDPNGNAVPEPGTFLLGLAGFGGVALKRWRKQRKVNSTDSPLSSQGRGGILGVV